MQVGKKTYSFTVELSVDAYNRGMAQEAISRLLRSGPVKDFRILPGPEAPAGGPLPEPGKADESTKRDGVPDVLACLETHQRNNTLLRLTAVTGKGTTMSIPCRVLNCEAQARLVTVYHVDEKKVYQFGLDEIVDLKTP